MDNDSEFNIVTEVGTFGSLNLEDPTAISVNDKKKKKNINGVELEELINEAVADNLKNLSE